MGNYWCKRAPTCLYSSWKSAVAHDVILCIQCDGPEPSVYARVSAVASWIERESCKLNSRLDWCAPSACGEVDDTVPVRELQDQSATFPILIDDGVADYYYSFSSAENSDFEFMFTCSGSPDIQLAVWDAGFDAEFECAIEIPCSRRFNFTIPWGYGNSDFHLVIGANQDITIGLTWQEFVFVAPVQHPTCGLAFPAAAVRDLFDQPSTIPVVVDQFGRPDFHYEFSAIEGSRFVFQTCYLTTVDVSEWV